MKSVGIIGGGIIGLSSAYFLNKAGHQVTIMDQGDFMDGCSFGNAGMIVPSHLIPLAAPGMMSKGIRWMFNSASPFYVKPSWNRDLLRWGYQFYKKSTKEHVEKSAPALRDLSLFSKSVFKEWSGELPFAFGYQEKGLLMLYQTKETEHEESDTAAFANRHGIEAHLLSGEEVQQLEPDMQVKVRGGVYFPGDAHVTPQDLVNGLKDLLKKSNVEFRPHTRVTDFRTESGTIKETMTTSGSFDFDEIILAAGAWSGILAARLGLTLPMQAGKGYSFTLQEVKRNTKIPSIFLEERVAVTPMGMSLRFGGTMEISGVNHDISMNRVKGIVNSIARYYPDMKVAVPAKEKIWHGLRPCSPDGLPYLGRTLKIKNLIVAAGHGMMGLSLGPGTGKIVAELTDHRSSGVALDAFAPERYC